MTQWIQNNSVASMGAVWNGDKREPPTALGIESKKDKITSLRTIVSLGRKVRMRWVKSHIDIIASEWAGEAANTGALKGRDTVVVSFGGIRQKHSEIRKA